MNTLTELSELFAAMLSDEERIEDDAALLIDMSNAMRHEAEMMEARATKLEAAAATQILRIAELSKELARLTDEDQARRLSRGSIESGEKKENNS